MYCFPYKEIKSNDLSTLIIKEILVGLIRNYLVYLKNCALPLLLGPFCLISRKCQFVEILSALATGQYLPSKMGTKIGCMKS